MISCNLSKGGHFDVVQSYSNVAATVCNEIAIFQYYGEGLMQYVRNVCVLYGLCLLLLLFFDWSVKAYVLYV